MFISSIISAIVLGAASFTSCQEYYLLRPSDVKHNEQQKIFGKIPSTVGLEELFELKPIHSQQTKFYKKETLQQHIIDDYQSIVHINTFKYAWDPRIVQLYDQASQILIDFSYKKKLDSVKAYIKTFNDAAQEGIDEDKLAQFVFTQKGACREAIFFGMLKFHNRKQVANATRACTWSLYSRQDQEEKTLGEKKPYVCKVSSSLSEAIGFPEPKTQSSFMDDYVEDDLERLANKIYWLSNENEDYLRMLAKFFYLNKKSERKIDTLEISNATWRRVLLYLLFEKACSIRDDDELFQNINWDLVFVTIDYAKKNNFLNNESEFGYHILNYQSTWNDTFNMKPVDMSYAFMKEKMGAVWVFIEKYNALRGSKISPTYDDYRCYKMIQECTICAPSTFDTALLDPQLIAFKEYQVLESDMRLLRWADGFEIKRCVAKKYPLCKLV